MPRIAQKVRETLGETSTGWCQRNNIPAGFYITLVRKSNDRQVRKDMEIHRRVLPKRAKDDVRLTQALAELEAIFLTDLSQRRLELRLRYPDRKTNVDGNNRLGTIRNMDPDPDADLLAMQENDEIEDAENQFKGILLGIELEGVQPENVVRGVIRALIKEHGKIDVRRALEAESVL